MVVDDVLVFFFKQKTAYEMRISDWSSDVCSSDLEVTERSAEAKGSVLMQPATLGMIRDGGVKKGDVLSVARLAGIMGAKRTPDLIPLCHPLALTSVKVELTLDEERSAVDIRSEEHTSELQSLMRISYAVFCLKKKNT